ncbi:cellulase family glycosylhydrolase [Halobacteria archaeon AArc-m2/3/4]|uniref:Cellulase family glycosylhydrolase n=1 Tax=Natronoglomus mannanivorans TaxID=2979990 RepID=A0ABT2QCU3_9EURY|nr:cellulase family glycosylhydrolase [Halobacteria archaeon AArc-m2/3/4]
MAERIERSGNSQSRGEERAESYATRRTFLKAAGVGAGGLALGGVPGTVSANGVPTPRLQTDGKWITDPLGNEVKLRGFATASLDYIAYDWYPWSVREILEMATDHEAGWHPNHVRLPCEKEGIDEYGGIEPFVEEVLRPAVDYLAARNVYAMIDFHLIRPYTQAATEDYNEAEDAELEPIDDVIREFWNVVAPEFADDEHVLYELFNEPTYPLQWGEYGQTVDREESWLLWRDVAQPWVDLVREHAPETPIVIGSPDWTSETQFAPAYPFDGENLIYASHIYPANGQPDEFDEEYGDPAEEVPVVVTEFGWDPDGGQIDGATTAEWGAPFREWAESYENMGWTAWCFDDSWAPAMFESPPDNPQQGAGRPWALKDDENQHGGYIKSWLEETKDELVPESPVGDDVPPNPPADVGVVDAGEVNAQIGWEPATDPGEAGLSHYEIFLEGDHQGLVLPSEELTASLSGLEPNSSYEVSVVAVDNVDNESDPATVTVETIPYGSAQTPFDGPNAVPGRLPAEDFDAGGQGIAHYSTTAEAATDVDYRESETSVTLEESGETGYNIGHINAGEWWEYTVDVEGPGTYDLTVRVANGSNATYDPALSVHVDREAVASTVVWPTGEWDEFTEIRVGSVDLSAGEHIVRVVAESGGWNFDWIEFDGEPGDAPDPKEPTAPEDVDVVETTATSIELHWEAVPEAESYNVSLEGSLTEQVTESQVVIEDLEPDTTYELGVSSVAGEAESDSETVTVSTLPADGEGPPAIDGTQPADTTGDGLYNDITGSGSTTTTDVNVFFEHVDDPAVAEYPQYYDFDGNGQVSVTDVVELFESL